MITVDRDNFLAWTEGVLLERKGSTITRVGDDTAHERAEEAMDQGETIALTVDGRIISYMKLMDGAYTEFVGNAPD